MNQHAKITHWAERVDMAAAFRWTVRQNMQEAVSNHFSLAVNPEGTRFLINPNGRHFSRITASSLIEIDEARARHWLSVGAQPSQPVRRLLQKQGIV